MSSFYDKSSLVLIPSGTKTSKVFSQKPTNGDGDFDFTRSTAATRVNADGNIEKETSNLLTHSNGFLSWWSKPVSNITDGQAGYDGSNDASLLSKTGAAGSIYRSASVSGVQTFSVYAKAGTLNWIRLTSQSGNFRADVNLSTGAVGFVGSLIIDTNVTSLSNGWYRIELTGNATTTAVYLFPADGNNDVSGTSGNILIQDAQINQGLVAQPYQETTTTALYGGITDNVPRLDYTDSSCPALLLEPQRTNAMPHSEYFGSSDWSKTGASVVGGFTSPEGLGNAYKLVEDTSTGGHQIQSITSASNSTIYTTSVFVKYAGREWIRFTDAQSSNRIHFNTLTGVFGTISGTVIDYNKTALENGWYKLSFTTTSVATAYTPRIALSEADNDISYTGDGTSGVYLYGAQLESGSYATSYIPTYGTSVTRNNDETDVTGLQSKGILSSTQGTMFFHITDILGTAVVFNAQTANDLSYALRFVIRDIGFTTYQRVNNVQTTIRANNSLTLSEWKIAMSWNGTSLITSVNGTSYIDTIDASIASQLDKIARVNPQAISVTTNQILVFPTQLTEADLEILTGTYYESYSAMAAALNYTVYE